MKLFSKVAVASALLLSGIAAAPAAQATDDFDLEIDASGTVTLEGFCLEVDAAVDTSGVTLPPLPELPEMPEAPELPELPDHGDHDHPELPEAIDLPDFDAAQLVVVLSDGTEKVLDGSVTAGFSADIDTPAGVAVASAHLSLSADGADFQLQLGLCDTATGEESGTTGHGSSSGNGSAPPAEPVTGAPNFTG